MTEKPVSSTIVVPTAYGQMLVNRHDINQTNALFKTGKSVDDVEIQLMLQLLALVNDDDPVILDVGANLGAYTLAFAQWLNGKGKIYSIEAQRVIYYLLCGSVALNSHWNVHVLHAAAGRAAGQIPIPQFDYSSPLNFGSIEFGNRQVEAIEQERRQDRVDDLVPVIAIDSLKLEKLTFLKIDVEGMEIEVIAGAQETIKRCQPLMFIEVLKVDKDKLVADLQEMSYGVHDSGFNILCLPERLQSKIIVQRTGDAAAQTETA